MKRIATVLIVAIIAMSTIFAAQTGKNGGTKIVSTDAKTEVTLNLVEADITAFRIGFTNDKEGTHNANLGVDAKDDMTKLPTAAGALPLTYQKKDGFANNGTEEFYLYYKVRSITDFNLSLTSSGALTDGSHNIDYTITMGEGDAIVTAAGDTQNLTWTKNVTGMSDSKYVGKAIKMDIQTVAIPAGYAGEYVSTLTLNISPV